MKWFSWQANISAAREHVKIRHLLMRSSAEKCLMGRSSSDLVY
jgi:hypothetical protein